MILLNAEKAPDLLVTIACKAGILSLHDKSSLRLDRDALKSHESSSGVFGFQTEDGRIVGITSYTQSLQHHSVRFHIHFEGAERQEVKEALLLIQKLASSAGAVKASFLVCQEIDGIADLAKELGFLPEVKMRQHVYSGGQYISATEYGCVL